ncbi:MFS transporter [Candidatus Allofournierella excrementavium]|uniref:MFS transporter n=2 Tax=Candidatus Allofournierella excrementavium TaxID=2838591 RepID=UPI003AB7ECC3
MFDKRHGLLLFLNGLSSGLLSPLLTLLLLDRGLSLAAVPLAVGLYSAVAVIFEVPSGMAADRWGRKNCFLVSQALLLPGLGLLALGQGMAAVLAAMAFHGLARAFSSGSLDALVVEEFLLKNGAGALPRCTARVSALTSIGLAMGCLAGGGVYALTGRMWTALALKGALVLVLLALSAGLEEHPVERGQEEPNPAVQLAAALRSPGLVRALVLWPAALAPALFSVEVFYQPRFEQLLNSSAAGWALGTLSAGAFYASAAGAVLGPRLTRRPTLGRLLGVSALVGAGLMALSAAGTPVLFVAFYFLFYVVNGSTDYLTSTLMNEAAPPSQRATLLSASSLSMQLGGLAASPLLSAGAAVGTIPQVWLAAGGALTALMLVWLAVHLLRARKTK